MMVTILIAEDDTLILELLLGILAEEGYRVLGARDGAEALEIIGRERPDVMLTDNMMPALSGVELATIVRAHRAPTMPIVLMSAIAPPMLPPGVMFLPKPFDVDDVLAMLGAALNPEA